MESSGAGIREIREGCGSAEMERGELGGGIRELRGGPGRALRPVLESTGVGRTWRALGRDGGCTAYSLGGAGTQAGPVGARAPGV